MRAGQVTYWAILLSLSLTSSRASVAPLTLKLVQREEIGPIDIFSGAGDVHPGLAGSFDHQSPGSIDDKPPAKQEPGTDTGNDGNGNPAQDGNALDQGGTQSSGGSQSFEVNGQEVTYHEATGEAEMNFEDECVKARRDTGGLSCAISNWKFPEVKKFNDLTGPRNDAQTKMLEAQVKYNQEQIYHRMMDLASRDLKYSIDGKVKSAKDQLKDFVMNQPSAADLAGKIEYQGKYLKPLQIDSITAVQAHLQTELPAMDTSNLQEQLRSPGVEPNSAQPLSGDSVNSGLTTQTQSMAILNKPLRFDTDAGQTFAATWKDFITKDEAWAQQGDRAERALEERSNKPPKTLDGVLAGMVKAANDPIYKMFGSDIISVHPKGWEFRIKGGSSMIIKSRPWTGVEKVAAGVFGPLALGGAVYGIYQLAT